MLSGIRQASARAAARRIAVVRPVRLLTTESAPVSQPPALASTSSTSAEESTAVAPLSDRFPLYKPGPKVAPPPPQMDPLLLFFTTMIMRDGKKQAASKQVARMLVHVHAFTKAPPLPIVRQAVVIASPLLRNRQFSRAAKAYVFPTPLTERQRAHIGIKWILDASDKRGGKTLAERLAREIVAVVRGESEVLKKKEDSHKLAVTHRCVASVLWHFACLLKTWQRERHQASQNSEVGKELEPAELSVYAYISSIILSRIGSALTP